MNAALDLLTDALAAYRATKLVSDDGITQGPRDAIIRWAYRHRPEVRWEGRNSLGFPVAAVDQPDDVLTLDGALMERADLDSRPPGTWQDVAEQDPDPPKLAEWISCRWCVGAWCSAGVVVASTVAPRAWRPVARALALSSAAALLANLED